jgi:hypothetical protein
MYDDEVFVVTIVRISGRVYCPRVVNPSSGLGGLEGRQKMSEGCNPSPGLKGV